MNIGRAEIEVAVVVMSGHGHHGHDALVIGMLMMMVMMIVAMIVAEKPGACEIHAQAKDSDGYGFVIPNGDRVHEALHALIADEKRDHAEHDGAGKTGKVAELAGSEGEAVVVKMTPRVRVGQGRYRERGCVGRHVPAIRHEGERAEHRAADDFANHHDGGQAYNRPNALRILVVTRAQEHVLVLEGFDGVTVHLALQTPLLTQKVVPLPRDRSRPSR